ncbi:hypothetical protein ACOME3_001751 [Neoechinorhynchus agilis]
MTPKPYLQEFISDKNVRNVLSVHDQIQNVSVDNETLTTACQLDAKNQCRFYNLNRYIDADFDISGTVNKIRSCDRESICDSDNGDMILSSVLIGSNNSLRRSFASLYVLKPTMKASWLQEVKTVLNTANPNYELLYVVSSQLHDDIKSNLVSDKWRAVAWIVCSFIYLDFVLLRYNCWRVGICTVVFVRASIALFFTVLYTLTSFGLLLSINKDGVHVVPLATVLFYVMWTTINYEKSSATLIGALSSFAPQINATLQVSDIYNPSSMMADFVDRLISNEFVRCPSSLALVLDPANYSLIQNKDRNRNYLTVPEKMEAVFQARNEFDFIDDTVVVPLEAWFNSDHCCNQCSTLNWSQSLVPEMIQGFLLSNKNGTCNFNSIGYEDSYSISSEKTYFDAISIFALSKKHHTIDSIIKQHKLMHLFEQDLAKSLGTYRALNGSLEFPRAFFCSYVATFAEQFFDIDRDTMMLILLPIIPWFSVLALFSRLSWRQCILMPTLLTSTFVSSLGLMALVGIDLNALSLMNMVMVPSLAAQFYLPIAYMFSTISQEYSKDSLFSQCAMSALNVSLFFATVSHKLQTDISGHHCSNAHLCNHIYMC